MNIYSIYKATNKINNKCYIGYSSNIKKRIREHKSNALNSNDIAYNYIFHKSIRKYGWDNFEWEIIYKTNDLDVAKYMEKYFIQEYNSYYLWENGGYNMTLGGEGNVGLIFSPETIQKMKDNHWSKREGYINPYFGLKHSKETKEKQRNKKLGKKLSKITKEKIGSKGKGNKITFGRIWVNNGYKTKMVYPNNIPSGYNLGRHLSPLYDI